MAGFQHDDMTTPKTGLRQHVTAMGRHPSGFIAIADAHRNLNGVRAELVAEHGDRVVFHGDATMAMMQKFHDHEVWLMQEYSLREPHDERAADDAYMVWQAEEDKHRNATDGDAHGQ